MLTGYHLQVAKVAEFQIDCCSVDTSSLGCNAKLDGQFHLVNCTGFSNIAVGVQDTIRRPKVGSEASQMKKATTLAIAITTSFYMAVGTIGYGAFGDAAPTNLLTGFGFFNPYWLIDIANVFIMVHLVGAYQVWATATLLIGLNMRSVQPTRLQAVLLSISVHLFCM